MIQNSFFLKILVKNRLRPAASWEGTLSPKPAVHQAYLSNNRKLENSGIWSLSPKRHLIYSCKNMSSSTGTLRNGRDEATPHRVAPLDQEKKSIFENLGLRKDLGHDFVGNPGASSFTNQQSLFSHQKSKLPNIVSHKSDLSCVFSYVQSSETRLMNRFLNFLTKKGKKSTAESIFSKTLYLLIKKANEGTITIPHETHSIFTILDQAISNVKPFFEVKKVRVAGTTYQVPSLMKSKRQEGIAINWILQSASERKKKNPSQTFENCLAFEIFEAFQKQGQARMKRNELHKLAEANRAFSHFRWW